MSACDINIEILVVPTGFEPVTPRFGGEYSIQLSYGTICLFEECTAVLRPSPQGAIGFLTLSYIKPLAPYNPFSVDFLYCTGSGPKTLRLQGNLLR